jgi:hypothetical protein
MKLAAESKKPPSPKKSTPSRVAPDTSLFFRAMIKAADISQKEMTYELRVSKTLTDCWVNGTKNDPFTQERRAVAPFIARKRMDLLPAIVTYIIGVDNFDEVVLARIQEVLVKVVQP